MLRGKTAFVRTIQFGGRNNPACCHKSLGFSRKIQFWAEQIQALAEQSSSLSEKIQFLSENPVLWQSKPVFGQNKAKTVFSRRTLPICCLKIQLGATNQIRWQKKLQSGAENPVFGICKKIQFGGTEIQNLLVLDKTPAFQKHPDCCRKNKFCASEI